MKSRNKENSSRIQSCRRYQAAFPHVLEEAKLESSFVVTNNLMTIISLMVSYRASPFHHSSGIMDGALSQECRLWSKPRIPLLWLQHCVAIVAIVLLLQHHAHCLVGLL